jgi:S-DNA-T family DNA segregation ATPase FtsK/SpoIIIE
MAGAARARGGAQAAGGATLADAWRPVFMALNQVWEMGGAVRLRGLGCALAGTVLMLSLFTRHADDSSWNAAGGEAPRNLLGGFGATLSDVSFQSVGFAAFVVAALMIGTGLSRLGARDPRGSRGMLRLRASVGTLGLLCLAGALAAIAVPPHWTEAKSYGGFWGEGLLSGLSALVAFVKLPAARALSAAALWISAFGALGFASALKPHHFARSHGFLVWAGGAMMGLFAAREIAHKPARAPAVRRKAEPAVADRAPVAADAEEDGPPFDLPTALDPPLAIRQPKSAQKASGREQRENQKAFDFVHPGGFQLPELAMLAKPKPRQSMVDEAALRQNARLLETTLSEFGVKGVIDQIRPGPVVTLYELVPAPGVKSSRVIALADDIARSMSARSARVSVVSGRNAIGIELPNAKRETVYLRDLLSSTEFEKAGQTLPIALGENIGGEPYVADLAKMPHLLIAGTTGSGKSVGVNAMILSILYKLPPSECRFIMIDPKMLELSVYDGIPHLLAPVVTDPKKAIVALKWTVREMENRYRLMSKIGVRNVAGYNEKARDAIARNERFARTVQTGFDDAGRPVYETEEFTPEPMPMLVVVIDEVADLMMVAGKDIEGAVQRLAQMARAAGIHLIMATQRPSVDVITGTIKANFPTRISFQVTSKIDARTILGEQGAEQLLGQGDMLYMAGGGRVTRLHGPFVSDQEVEDVAKFLRAQGEPQYLEEVTYAPDEDGDGDEGGYGEGGGSGDDLYDQAVAVVTRDRKASTSYVQRRLQIGYNRAASLIEKMEREGVVSAANHAGKREILAGPPP